MKLGLQARFLLLLVLLLLVLFSTIAFILVRQNATTLRQDLNDRAVSFAELATKPIGDSYLIYRQSGSFRIDEQITKFTDLDENVTGVAIIDTGDKIVHAGGVRQQPAALKGKGKAFTPQYIKDGRGQLATIVQPYIEDTGLHRYSMVYTISSQQVNQSIQSTVTAIVGACLLGLSITLGLAYLLINRLFLRPVASVSQSALKISGGDYTSQISLNRSDEIGDLARAVNSMANSLKADIAKLKELDTMKSEFMMITAHNLRTPLTIIRNYLELLAEELKDDKSNQESVAVVQANVERLGVFAEDVLTVSTIENGKQILQLKPLPIDKILGTIVSEFTDYARHKQLNFTAEINAKGDVAISKPHFRSAIWNLLDNAAKFTAEGGNVKLEALQADNKYIVIISDSGIGIAEDELPKLFTKFHRATDTLKYNYEGVGIGLYSTKLIISQHGGTIEVNSELGKGTTFTITLPVPPTAS